MEAGTALPPRRLRPCLRSHVPPATRIVNRLDGGGHTAAPESSPAAVGAARTRPEASARDVADMASMVVERVRRVLSMNRPLDRTMVAFAILWLADKDLRDLATRALRKAAPHIPGQLADSLCDPDVDVELRRRVPRLLSECPTQPVAEALLRGAEDPRFEVRYECGRALLRITRANPHLVIPLRRVIAVVKLEVSLDRGVWEGQSASDLEGDAGELTIVGRLLRDRADRSLEHVFSLLALNLDRDSLVIAFRALHAATSAFAARPSSTSTPCFRTRSGTTSGPTSENGDRCTARATSPNPRRSRAPDGHGVRNRRPAMKTHVSLLALLMLVLSPGLARAGAPPPAELPPPARLPPPPSRRRRLRSFAGARTGRGFAPWSTW